MSDACLAEPTGQVCPIHDDHAHHGHHHDHHHGHGHSHAPANFGRVFAIGVVLNGGFVVLEVIYGLLAHSLALVADAGHNLGDVFGLLMAWAAAWWAQQQPTDRHTYGWGRFSIYAALGNAVILLLSVAVIVGEAVVRLQHPVPIAARTMIWVAAIGIAINGSTAWLFTAGRKDDLNVRATFQHMAADALLSGGVVVAGAVILFTRWIWLDPVLSLLLAVVIVVGTWRLLREAVDLALDAVPASIDVHAVQEFLLRQPGVREVHHVHVWGLSTTETALTAHLVVPAGRSNDELLRHLNHELEERFHIGHATLQFESDPLPECAEGECGAHADHPCSKS
ncbi:MAG TPA: cation diffusion facilitator family transporter [Opitutaceae bacterium]|jgi:cobalt-zinc-cadmium efflux system protein